MQWKLYLFLGYLLQQEKNILKGIIDNFREFEQFGPIKKVRIIKDKRTEKSKGYAFIEFEHKKDFNDAYKEADGMKIDGRRV